MSRFKFPEVDHNTPLGAALAECEVHCVALCCGMDAYDIAVERFQRWADSATRADLERARSQVTEALEALQQTPERFYFLDCDHTRSEVTAWFELIRITLAAVTLSSEHRPPSSPRSGDIE